jgi:hypothetical protein
MVSRRARRTVFPFFAVVALLAVAALDACGVGGENGSNSGSSGSSGAGSSSGSGVDGSLEGGADAPVEDSAKDAPAAADGGGPDASAPPPTTALFLQASPSLSDVRLCWAVGGQVVTGLVPFPGAGAMPGSNYPGIPLGGAAAMGDARSLAAPDLVLYAIDALVLARFEQAQAAAFTCDQLVCTPGNTASPCLRPNLDYWQLTPVGQGPRAQTDNVVAIGGCLAKAIDPAATVARCGPTWTDVAGNLHAEVLYLTPAAAGGGAVAVQAAQLSPGLGALLGDAGFAQVAFGTADGADASNVATLHAEGELADASRSVAVGQDLAAYGALGFSVDVPADDSGAGHVWMSLAQSQQLVDPTQDPTLYYGQSRPYVVAVLGDPSAPHAFATGYDGRGLHLLVVAAARPPPAGGDP